MLRFVTAKRRPAHGGERPEEFAERVLRLVAESRDPQSLFWRREAARLLRRRR